jgi:hypothetical protein
VWFIVLQKKKKKKDTAKETAPVPFPTLKRIWNRNKDTYATTQPQQRHVCNNATAIRAPTEAI